MNITTIIINPPGGSISIQAGAPQLTGSTAGKNPVEVVEWIITIGRVIQAIIVIVPERGQIKIISRGSIGVCRPIQNNLGD